MAKFIVDGTEFLTLAAAKKAAVKQIFRDDGAVYDAEKQTFVKKPVGTFTVTLSPPPVAHDGYDVGDYSFETLDEALQAVWDQGANEVYLDAMRGDKEVARWNPSNTDGSWQIL